MGSSFSSYAVSLFITAAVFALVTGGILLARVPLSDWLNRRLVFFTDSLYRLAWMDTSPRIMMWVSAALVPVMALAMVMVISLGSATELDPDLQPGSLNDMVLKIAAAALGMVAAIIGPTAITKFLIRRRILKLEEQIVSGIQTIASGVRAGLNLVQAMQLLARNASKPLSQEIAQLLREYEHGLTLEQAMAKTGRRIGSPTYRLLFSALETHRIRGGNLAETLESIADAIREIQRLEKHVETLTAQGQSAARMMAIMPLAILVVLYFIDKKSVSNLFTTQMGRFMLLGIGMVIFLSFWWIRRIIDIDI
jgi:tight adherence protein B